MASIYIHIPFCVKKCLYCDFYSVENQEMRGAFLAALNQEIVSMRPGEPREQIDTIFFGGGTPSLLLPGELESILDSVRSTYSVHPDAEVTVEANPGTLDRDQLRAYRGLGVNRLSIGVQSFHEDELLFLSRIHSADESVRAVEDARAAGFENLSLDLIFSLPGQTPERWEESLDRAIALGPDHISAYSLIVESNTPLFQMVAAGEVTPNTADAEGPLYERTMDRLASAGYAQYEVSSYERGGKRCRHNLAYWSHVNYAGFGPSAHSFRAERGWTGARRWWNAASIRGYCEAISAGRSPVASEERVDRNGLIRERIFLGLRSSGIDWDTVASELGASPGPGAVEVMAALEREGMAEREGPVFRLTRRGMMVCDEIAARLLP